MGTKHTPAPWVATGNVRLVGDPNSTGGQHNTYVGNIRSQAEGASWTDICTQQSAIHVDGGIGIEEAKANARLIAAAPELLEALEGVVRVADRKTIEFDAAHAAIAKAKGE